MCQRRCGLLCEAGGQTGGRKSVVDGDPNGRRPVFFACRQLFIVHDRDHFAATLAEVEFHFVHWHPCLLQDALRLDDDMETPVDMTNKASGHAGKTARVIGDLGLQNADGNIDFFEVAFVNFQPFHLQAEVGQRPAVFIEASRLEDVDNSAAHVAEPVSDCTFEFRGLVTTHGAEDDRPDLDDFRRSLLFLHGCRG